jgi:sulfite exporter TauE/SafE
MEALLAHCNSLFSAEGGFLLAFFIGGLTGGFTHCLAMCGSFAACGSCTSQPCNSTMVAMGFPYHLGRMTTYGALGFLVALLSKQISTTHWWPLLSSLMLAGAGVLFLVSFVKSCRHGALSTPSRLTYLRGAMLGFMPCGLLYAALMMAATLANPLHGMVAMWVFTLGTLPALLIASGGAELLSRKWQHAMQHVGRAMMAFNGLSLLVMAARVMR